MNDFGIRVRGSRSYWRAGLGLLGLVALGVACGQLPEDSSDESSLGELSQPLVGSWSLVGAPAFVTQLNQPVTTQWTGVAKDIEIGANQAFHRLVTLDVVYQRSAATGWGWVSISHGLVPAGSPAGPVQFSAVGTKPSDMARLLVGTGDGASHSHQGDALSNGGTGLYLSTNGTNPTPSWTRVLTQAETGGTVRKIYWRQGIFDSNVFVATQNGLWKSTNSGASFARVLTGTIWDVAIGTNNQLYATVNGSGLLRSFDWGVTWSYCHPTTGADAGFAFSSIATAPSDKLYLLRGKNLPNTGFEGVYQIQDSSTAAGSCVSTKFNNVPLADLGGASADWYGAIVKHPNDTQTVLVAGMKVLRTQNALNGAVASWQDVTSAMHPDIHDLQFNGGASNTVWAAGDGGLHYSTAAGAGEWFGDANSFPAMSIYDFDITPTASRLYGARWHTGVFTTDFSSANSWVSTAGGSDAFAATVDPFNASRAWYSAWPGGCRARTTDTATTWLDANGGIGCSSNDSVPIEHDKVSPIYLYTLYMGAPYKSTNGGSSWTALSYPGGNWTGLAVGKYSGGSSTIYGFNKISSLYASKAGGAFVDITPAGPGVSRVVTHPTAPNTAFAVGYQHAYKTTTAAAGSWVELATSMTWGNSVATDIAFDPTNDQILFLATNLGGIYKSTNGGTTWTRWVNGFPNGGSKTIYRLRTVDLRSGGGALWIYAAVGSSGIWKRDASTDGG